MQTPEQRLGAKFGGILRAQMIIASEWSTVKANLNRRLEQPRG